MIKFFRNIRRELAAENKPAKYLRYAVGEILLVVIGILIAVQINNYNELRKSKLKERAMLENLLAAIEGDLETYDEVFEWRLDAKKRGVDSLFNYVYWNKPIEDSVFIDFYLDLSVDIVPRFNNGAFEALKSSGLELIKNDSLRNKINRVYTVTFPTFMKFISEVRDGYKMELDKREQKMMKLIPIIHEDGRQHMHLYPKIKNIIQSEDFLWVLKMEANKYTNYINRMNFIKEAMNSLKRGILIELEQ